MYIHEIIQQINSRFTARKIKKKLWQRLCDNCLPTKTLMIDALMDIEN